jgi:hypothetical protein
VPLNIPPNVHQGFVWKYRSRSCPNANPPTIAKNKPRVARYSNAIGKSGGFALFTRAILDSLLASHSSTIPRKWVCFVRERFFDCGRGPAEDQSVDRSGRVIAGFTTSAIFRLMCAISAVWSSEMASETRLFIKRNSPAHGIESREARGGPAPLNSILLFPAYVGAVTQVPRLSSSRAVRRPAKVAGRTSMKIHPPELC